MMNHKIIVGAVFLVAVIVICASAFRGFGTISDNAYQLATATYGACMAQSVERLDRVQSMLDDEEFVSGMSKKEVRWFKSIFEQARNNQWQAAAQTAKRMMEDQVEY